MLANLTLADAQLQIGATIVLLIAAYSLGWFSARAKDRLQRELLDAGMDLPPAQMTPFRGPLGPAVNDQPSTINDRYTEHSPQIPELRKPSGPFEDDWRGGEYGGSNSMLMRVTKEKEVED